MKCIAYIDGGRLPGTNLTTIGGIIFKDDVEISRYSEIGEAGSNADAEWQSLIRCMKLATKHNIPSLHIKTDFRQVADMLKTEYEILHLMITKLELNPDNRGLKKAISIRTKQKFGSRKKLKEWVEKNKSSLEATINIPHKYRNEIVGAMANLNITLEWIPREENNLADALCKKGRKKVNIRFA